MFIGWIEDERFTPWDLEKVVERFRRDFEFYVADGEYVFHPGFVFGLFSLWSLDRRELRHVISGDEPVAGTAGCLMVCS